MASFPLFPSFPVEIQLAVWAFAAVPDPEPEVCLVWPLRLDKFARPPEEPVLPFIVDTAWPAVAHVCRAAREVALKSGAVRLRHSSLAGFAVPYRHFIPAIDTLFWGRSQYHTMCIFLNRPENAHIARDLRHLALDASAFSPASEVAELIRKKAIYLQTLRIVVPGTTDLKNDAVSFIPPARRCRLRNISDHALDEVKIVYVSGLREGETHPMPLRKFLDYQRASLDYSVRIRSVRGDEGTAWSTRDDAFSGLEITAQTFVEYRYESNQVQWIEVCKDRLLNVAGASSWPRRILQADLKNPEVYRGVDDDSGLYTMEESNADFRRDHPELFAPPDYGWR